MGHRCTHWGGGGSETGHKGVEGSVVTACPVDKAT